MRGHGGVPQDATAVWLNLTVADPTTPTVLTAYPGPCGTAPLSSNVNARSLRSTASSVLVGVGANGSVCVLTYTGSSHIVVDVAGWFGPGADGLAYRPSPPVRLLDTAAQRRCPDERRDARSRRCGLRPECDCGRQHRAGLCSRQAMWVGTDQLVDQHRAGGGHGQPHRRRRRCRRGCLRAIEHEVTPGRRPGRHIYPLIATKRWQAATTPAGVVIDAPLGGWRSNGTTRRVLRMRLPGVPCC